jgi:hypothetical protein
MSDFDVVLERLLSDPAFQTRLAADPSGTLAGYRLSADEMELLRAQVSGDTGGHHQVEQRTSKASLFGLLSPLGGMGSLTGAAAHAGTSGAGQGLGLAGPIAGFGDVSAGGSQGLLDASAGGGQGLVDGGAGGVHGLSDAAHDGLSAAQDHLDSGNQAIDQAQSGVGNAPFGQDRGALLGRNLAEFGHDSTAQSGMGPAPIDNYHARVDVDGDGKWDEHTYAARADGGVDIVVDSNHDGKADFIGVDHDRDGLIDESYVDSNHDGVMDSHYVDVNHDGWLDKKVPLDRGQGTTYVSRHAAPPEEGLSAAD